MAGPEDSSTSSHHHHHHHHGTAQDPSADLRMLHNAHGDDDDEVDCLMTQKKKNNSPLAISAATSTPSPTPTVGNPLPPCDSSTDTLALKSQQHLRIDLRERKELGTVSVQMSQCHSSSSSGPKTCVMTGSDINVSQSSSLLTPPSPGSNASQSSSLLISPSPGSNASQSSSLLTSPSPGNNASLPVRQDDDDASDVFDVSSHHPHLFYIQDDDDNNDDDDDDGIDDDEEEEEDNDRYDAFENSDRDQEEVEEEVDGKGCGSPGHSLQDCPEDSVRGATRSSPISIPSPLTTVCRGSRGSQVVVRCQIPSPRAGSMRKSSSCPAAFSPLWAQIMPAEPLDRSTGGRRRSSSLYAGCAQNVPQPFGQSGPSTGTEGDPAADSQQLMTSPGHQQDVGHDHDPVTLQGGPDHAGFRGRSYSDSDVQRLLIKEMSLELRKIGDEFNRSRTRRRTFGEPIIEETGAFDM